MKLRTRLTAGVLTVLLAALGAASFLYISFSKKTLWENEKMKLSEEAAEMELRVESSLSAVRSEPDVSVGDSLLRYFFTKETRDRSGVFQYALYRDDKIICNNTGFRFPALLPPEKRENEMLLQNNGTYGIAKRELAFFDTHCTVYVLRDIGEISEKARNLVLSCMAVGLAVALASGIAVFAFLRYALSPLETLEAGAREIAAGNYGKRVSHRGRDELGALSESFNRMADAVQTHIETIEDTAEKRKLLLSALAHEMRTPVTAIAGYSYALKNAKLSGEESEEAVDFIDSESRRLERLSGKLSQLIGLDSGFIKKEKIALKEWGNELAGRYREDSRIFVDFPDQGFLIGDRDLLTVLVTNLCRNAQNAGADKIKISFCQGVLSVSDNGCGIAEKDISRITEPFFRADTSRGKEGFGLGLALCRKIASLYGSTLQIRSEVGCGSVFSLDLNNSFTIS